MTSDPEHAGMWMDINTVDEHGIRLLFNQDLFEDCIYQNHDEVDRSPFRCIYSWPSSGKRKFDFSKLISILKLFCDFIVTKKLFFSNSSLIFFNYTM